MGKLVLVAEDEQNIRDLLVTFLQMGGFKVVAVCNGAEAIAQARACKPDLILLDVHMPEMDGYQACEVLKAAPDTKDIPVVFVSAYANKDQIEHGLALGAAKYLAKPFAFDALTQQLTDVLEQVNTRRSDNAVAVA